VSMFNFLKRKYTNLVTDTSFSEILTGSVWSFSAQIMAAALGMANSIIVARFYGASILGVVAMLNSFLMLTTIFTVLGTNTSILRLIPEHTARHSPSSAFRVYRKTQYFVASISVFTGAYLFFASGFIADALFSKPHLSTFFAIAAAFVLFQSLVQLNAQAIRGLRLIKAFAFLQVLPFISKLTILIFITIFFFNPYNPVYAMFASIAVTALAGIWIMNHTFKQKMQPADSVSDLPLKDILRLSLPMLMTATMYFVIGQTGVIILGVFKSEADVGYYAVAVRLATLTTYILQATGSMAAPKFSELFHTGKMDELFHVAQKSTKLILWTTTPIMLILLFLGLPVIHFMYGAEFTQSYPALTILLVGYFVSMASGANGLFMNMTGNQNVFRNIMLVAAAINIGLNLLLIPRFGIYGAALAATISLTVWNITTLLYMKLKFGRTTGYFPFLQLPVKRKAA